jgi:hypothetical protein
MRASHTPRLPTKTTKASECAEYKTTARNTEIENARFYHTPSLAESG